MEEPEVPRYALVDCVVVVHRHYGPVTRTAPGDVPGYVDCLDLSDDPAAGRADWPAVGQQLTCVVLGTTKDGRLRLSARPRDVELVGAVADLPAALATWRAVRDGGGAAAEFLRADDAVPVLRWALRHPAGSGERTRAEALIERAPDGVQRALRYG
ncbi:hypothetical protein [Kitasatospora sp. NPDC004531]